MKQTTICILVLAVLVSACKFKSAESSKAKDDSRFNMAEDLLLAQFDCKTDVDDLHTVAAFAMMMQDDGFKNLNYHAIAGTYGIQEGLYVPPNELFELAFGNNWTDAHLNIMGAVEKVKPRVMATLDKGGDIWIAEAGQSDFSAELIKAVQNSSPAIKVSERFHVVQHSDWNEDVTDPSKLQFVQQTADYHKIPDGNATGNGTPGFRTPEFTAWKSHLTNVELIQIWQLAIDLGNKYNGAEGRYMNEAILAGGLDFSDLSEVCWILGLEDIKDTEQFFSKYSK